MGQQTTFRVSVWNCRFTVQGATGVPFYSQAAMRLKGLIMAAIIGDLVVNLGADSRNLRREMFSMRDFMGSLTSGFSGALNGLVAKLGAVYSVGQLISTAKWGISLAAQAETSQISFEVLLGSAEKAKLMLSQLKEYADHSPFDVAGTNEAAQKLLNYSIQAQDILPTIKMLGDVAAGDMDKFDRLSTAFGQMASTGRLMGQDLLQFINAGFNPLQEIAKQTGESMAELKKRMEAGGISSREVAGAFKAATSEGGRFFNMTERQSATAAGKWSTFKDTMATSAKEVGQVILESFDISSGIEKLGGFVAQIPHFFRDAGSLIQVEVINWQLYLDELIPGTAQLMADIGIIFQASWAAITAGFSAFIENIKGGLQEAVNLMNAIKAGQEAHKDRSEDDFISETIQFWKDDLLMTIDGLTAPFHTEEKPLLARFGSKPKDGPQDEEGHHMIWPGFNKALAEQQDVPPPAKDPFQEAVKAGREAMEKLVADQLAKAGTLKEQLAKQRSDLTWDMIERGEQHTGFGTEGWGLTLGGKEGDSFNGDVVKKAAKEAKSSKSDNGMSQAALRGTAEANKIMTSGFGGSVMENLAKEQVTALKSMLSELKTGFGKLTMKGVTDGAKKLGADLLGSQAGGPSGIHFMAEMASQLTAIDFKPIFGDGANKPLTIGQARASRIQGEDDQFGTNLGLAGRWGMGQMSALAERLGESVGIGGGKGNAADKLLIKQLKEQVDQTKLLNQIANQQPQVMSF
jgi:tape measure domain-containing protein